MTAMRTFNQYIQIRRRLFDGDAPSIDEGHQLIKKAEKIEKKLIKSGQIKKIPRTQLAMYPALKKAR